MNVIRYTVPKHDLHELLRTLGVLGRNETLLLVNNQHLLADTHSSVVITVGTDLPGGGARTEGLKNAEERVMQLILLRDQLVTDLRALQDELVRLTESGSNAEQTEDKTSESVPESVERSILNQVRQILSETDKSDPDPADS